MKKIAVEQLPPEIAALLEGLERGRVLITRGGEPFAVVASVGNKDEEDLELEESPEFWRMIRDGGARRRPSAWRIIWPSWRRKSSGAAPALGKTG